MEELNLVPHKAIVSKSSGHRYYWEVRVLSICVLEGAVPSFQRDQGQRKC